MSRSGPAVNLLDNKRLFFPGPCSLNPSPPLAQVQAIPGPKLYVVANGQGSPCMDFRRVPDILAEACIGTDLLIIEGMGR